MHPVSDSALASLDVVVDDALDAVGRWPSRGRVPPLLDADASYQKFAALFLSLPPGTIERFVAALPPRTRAGLLSVATAIHARPEALVAQAERELIDFLIDAAGAP